ncbi:MAG: c-type cytochrome biogenesis protein CcmI [Nevskiales bacterium]
MTTNLQFLLAAVLLTVLILAWLLRPLLRGPRATSNAANASRQALNSAIYRDQLIELESDRAAGSLAEADCEQARVELQQRLLQDAAQADVVPAATSPARPSALALALLLPLGAALMYLWLGHPGAMTPPPAEHQVASAGFEEMVESLAARLKQNPDDLQGWVMLARSYKAMQRFDEAEKAFEHIVGIDASDPALLTEYADLLAFRTRGNFEGKPLDLVNRALKVDPLNPMALNLAGTAAFNRQDFAAAAGYWTTLLKTLPPESEDARAIAASLADAKQKAGTTLRTVGGTPVTEAAQATPAGPGKSVSGKVALAKALAAGAQPDDTLFVFARAANGPRMPLAVLRKRVADLPLSFTLDDSLALNPEMKISSVAEVKVEARISKSGQAMPQQGDLVGESSILKLGATNVNITIDRAVP